MKKRMVLLVAGMSICLFAACGTKNETGNDVKEKTEVQDTVDATEETLESSEENETATEEQEVYEYPSEDAGKQINSSSLGYSMEWDPTIFVLKEEEGTDEYFYNTPEALAAPIYIGVQLYSDMDAQTLAEGLALQSGIDGVVVEDAYFADSIEVKLVHYEKEEDGVTQAFAYDAIPVEEGTLLVEIGGYVGMPEEAEIALEEMLGTFTLQEE